MALFARDNCSAENHHPDEKVTAQFHGPGWRLMQYIAHYDRVKQRTDDDGEQAPRDKLQGRFQAV